MTYEKAAEKGVDLARKRPIVALLILIVLVVGVVYWQVHKHPESTRQNTVQCIGDKSLCGNINNGVQCGTGSQCAGTNNGTMNQDNQGMMLPRPTHLIFAWGLLLGSGYALQGSQAVTTNTGTITQNNTIIMPLTAKVTKKAKHHTKKRSAAMPQQAAETTPKTAPVQMGPVQVMLLEAPPSRTTAVLASSTAIRAHTSVSDPLRRRRTLSKTFQTPTQQPRVLPVERQKLHLS